MTETIGYTAAIQATLSFPPQALRIWHTRNTQAISLGMYSAFSIGVGLWIVYGALLRSWPLMLANLITLILALSILVMKIRYARRMRRQPQ